MNTLLNLKTNLSADVAYRLQHTVRYYILKGSIVMTPMEKVASSLTEKDLCEAYSEIDNYKHGHGLLPSHGVVMCALRALEGIMGKIGNTDIMVTAILFEVAKRKYASGKLVFHTA
jgi:hypothetical protein